MENCGGGTPGGLGAVRFRANRWRENGMEGDESKRMVSENAGKLDDLWEESNGQAACCGSGVSMAR
jgi:hypothetical protein